MTEILHFIFDKMPQIKTEFFFRIDYCSFAKRALIGSQK